MLSTDETQENFASASRRQFSSGNVDLQRHCFRSIEVDKHTVRQCRFQRLAQYVGLLALVIAFLGSVHDGDAKHSQAVHSILGGISQRRPGSISLWVVTYLVAWQITLSSTFRKFIASIRLYFASKNLHGRSLSRNTIHTSASNFAQMVRVSSTETIARLSSAVKLLSATSTRKRSVWIAERESFLPLTTIASMTLKEIADLFLFLSESSHRDFRWDTALDSMSASTRQALQAIEIACLKSKAATPPSASTSTLAFTVGKGDVDALLFASVVRIFAEWRYIRLVPDGYKRYAVGMALARRDLLQNIAKLEQAVHQWLDHQHQQCGPPADGEHFHVSLASPTLRQLLDLEVEQGIHPKLPRLIDKSGANGLLWIYRQLTYQTFIFSNTLEIPSKFPTTNAAVVAAYRDAYGAYHSWPVQQIFQQSFRAAPDLKDVLSCMIPLERQNMPHAATVTTTTIVPSESVDRKCTPEMTAPAGCSSPTLKQTKNAEDIFQQWNQAMADFAMDVSMKWHTFLDHLNCMPVNNHTQSQPSIGPPTMTPRVSRIIQERKIAPIKAPFAPVTELDQADLDALMATERASVARLQITEFNQVMNSTLQYLNNLIVEDFGMNDPTRV